MSLIGRLAIGISANAKPMEKGTRRAKRSLKSLNKTTSLVSSGFKRAALAATGFIAGFVAIRSVISRVNEAAERIDNLAKTSDRLGIATRNLAGMQLAGEQTGVEINTLNMAMQRMTRRIAEAANGTGEAKNALAELGLSARELGKLSPDKQFSRIADAMKSVTGQGDKVRLSMRLFDSEGVKLVNTLALGSDGLQAFERQAEKMGLAVSRVDAAKIEMMNDSLNMGSKVMDGFFNKLSVGLAPVISGIVDDMVEWASTGDNLSSTVDQVVSGIETAAVWVMQIVGFARTVAHTFTLVATIIAKGVLSGINMVSKNMKGLIDIASNFGTAFEQVKKLFSAALSDPIGAAKLLFVKYVKFVTGQIVDLMEKSRFVAGKLGFGDALSDASVALQIFYGELSTVEERLSKSSEFAGQLEESAKVFAGLLKDSQAPDALDGLLDTLSIFEQKTAESLDNASQDWLDAAAKVRAYISTLRTAGQAAAEAAAASSPTAGADGGATPLAPTGIFSPIGDMVTSPFTTMLEQTKKFLVDRNEMFRMFGAGLTEQERQRVNSQVKIEESGGRMRMAALTGNAQAILGGFQALGNALLKDTKAFNIGMAIANTALAVTKFLSLGQVGLAVAAGLNGAAQVAAIAKAGKGSGSLPGVMGRGGGATIGADQQQAPTVLQTQSISIEVRRAAGGVSREEALSLYEALTDVARDRNDGIRVGMG